MEHFFVSLFQVHWAGWAQWGIPIIFTICFLESLPLLGAILPGQTLLMFAGFMIKLGIFGFWPALVAAAGGAILGDLSGFGLGKRYGPKILQKEKWIIDRKHFERTTALLNSNSIKSIFIGRLHSFTRTLMPFAAGMSAIKTKKFIIIDVLSALSWAFGSLAIGFVFGKSFEIAAKFIGKFALMSTLIAIIIFATVSHIKSKDKKNVSLNAVLSGLSVTFLYLFTIVASGYASGKGFRILDVRVEHLLAILHTNWLTSIMVFFSSIGGPIILPIAAAFFVLYLISKSKWADAIFVSFTIGIGNIITNILKALFQRARPLPGIIAESGTSFPSGHAMMAAIAGIVLYYVSLRKIKDNQTRVIATFGVVAIAFAIGLSRVYLNVHWASDVLGGFFAGIFVATFAIIIFRLVMFITKRSKRNHTLTDIL